MSAESWEDPRRVLARHGLAPKRAFSQNFLVSRHAVEGIVRALALKEGDLVIELGPGLGTLTGELLRTGARVIAVEKDREMIAVLKAELGDNERFEVIEGDAATVDIAKLAGRDRVALAGNLPYAITGEIMRNLGKYAENISRAAVMVQMEVRDRLIAEPNTREYGVLSVFIQARFDVRTALKVSANAFHPPPKVESAVVMMVPREVPRAEETERFRTVVRGAFQARRKTLRNALVQAVGAERADEALSRAGIDGRRRGETLSIEEFAKIAQELH